MGDVPARVTSLPSVIVEALPGTATETLPHGDRSPGIAVSGVPAPIESIRMRRMRRS